MLIIRIHNDGTGDTATGNYDYSVSVNTRIIAEGRIEGHCRADGWKTLVQKLVDDDNNKRLIKSSPKPGQIRKDALTKAIEKVSVSRKVP